MTLIHFKDFSAKVVAVAILFTLTYGCNSEKNEGDNSSSLSDTLSASNATLSKAQNIFYSIPSPIETASLLKKAGATFDKSYLNPTENVSKYTSTTSQISINKLRIRSL